MKPLILSVFFFFCCKLVSAQTTLDCVFKGITNDTIFVEVNPLDITKNYDDTVVAKNGGFTYKKDIATPTMFMIKSKSAFETMSNGVVYLPHSKRIFVLALPNDSIHISGAFNKDAVTYSISSSVSFNQRLQEEHLNKLGKAKITLNLQREIELQADPQRKAKLMREYMLDKDNSRTVKMDYISRHPDDDWSAFLLIGSAMPNEFLTLYNVLSERVKNGLFKSMLDSRMLLSKQKLGIITDVLTSGTTAPDFSVTSIAGNRINLSDYRGQYVLLDFWGTWCAPCLNEIPKMKSYYDRYAGKIQFVGIACNDRKEKVIETARSKGLTWAQALDYNGINTIARAYKVQSFPTKILIDKDGVIVDVFIGESDAAYKKMDELMLQ